MVEDIERFYGLLPLLLVTKDQVYPLMEVGGDVVTLQGLPVDPDEFVGIPLCPGGKYDIAQLLPRLLCACGEMKRGGGMKGYKVQCL